MELFSALLVVSLNGIATLAVMSIPFVGALFWFAIPPLFGAKAVGMYSKRTGGVTYVEALILGAGSGIFSALFKGILLYLVLSHLAGVGAWESDPLRTLEHMINVEIPVFGGLSAVGGLLGKLAGD